MRNAWVKGQILGTIEHRHDGMLFEPHVIETHLPATYPYTGDNFIYIFLWCSGLDHSCV